MQLMGWAPTADPRERLILTAKQLKREMNGLWVRHLCACDTPGPAFSVPWSLIGMDRDVLKAILERSWRMSVELEIYMEIFKPFFLFFQTCNSRK